MLDHGLQHLLHALTHDTVSCDSFSVKAIQRRMSLYVLVFHIIVLLRRVRIFIEPLVDLVLRFSSEPVSAAYSITARSASLRMLLTRCSVDLLHLDQFSWTLSNVGGTPRSFHASSYLGLTQVLNFGTTYLSTLPRSQPLVVVAAAHSLRGMIGVLATRSPLVAH